jgi:hypothetical protein
MQNKAFPLNLVFKYEVTLNCHECSHKTKQSTCGNISSDARALRVVPYTSTMANYIQKRATSEMHIPNGTRQTYDANLNRLALYNTYPALCGVMFKLPCKAAHALANYGHSCTPVIFLSPATINFSNVGSVQQTW